MGYIEVEEEPIIIATINGFKIILCYLIGLICLAVGIALVLA